MGLYSNIQAQWVKAGLLIERAWVQCLLEAENFQHYHGFIAHSLSLSHSHPDMADLLFKR